MPSSHAFLAAVIGHASDPLGAGAGLLGHQGGWDEILMVAGPIVIFAVLLRTANRRAARMEQEGDGSDDSDGSDPGAAAPPVRRRGPI